MAFDEEADERYGDTSNLISMELKSGEQFLFEEKLLRHSEPNRSTRRHIEMSVRVTLQIVNIDNVQITRALVV